MAYSLKTLVQQALSKQHAPAWHITLFERWHTIVGDLNQVMRLEKIVGNMLIIGVYDASWMQELHMLSSVLVQTINQHLDVPHINRIRFRQVARSTIKKTRTAEQPVSPMPSLPSLTTKQQAVLNKITDEQLRTYLHTFLGRLRLSGSSDSASLRGPGSQNKKRLA